jgi:AcrR family transcriptional regulator
MGQLREEITKPASDRRGGQPNTRKVPRSVREPQMLAMAGRIFALRGFHDASMDEIAEAAGISKPMLYLYFSSKEGLYFAYVDQAYGELISAIDEAVAADGRASAAEMLRAGTWAYYRYVGEHRDAFAVLFREMGDPGGKLAQQRRRLRNRVVSALEAIQRRSGDANVAPGSAEPLAEAWLGAARALANWWLDHPEISAEAMTDQLMSMTFAGLDGLLGDSRPAGTPRSRQPRD